MNSYRVHYTKTEGGDSYPILVTATSREDAQYAAFDHLTDKGIPLHRFGDIWILNGEAWVITYDHRVVSATVG